MQARILARVNAEEGDPSIGRQDVQKQSNAKDKDSDKPERKPAEL